MKTNIKNILKASLLSAFAFLSMGCNTDPEYHSTVAPEIFFTSQETVWQRFSRPMTHWKWHFGTNDHHSDVQELGTDEICLPTRNGDWYDGGQYQNIHHHNFQSSVGMFHNNFYGVGMGVALAYDALEDIDAYVDFEALKFPEGTKESMISQLNIIIAHLYKDGLDKFGGMNIYTREEAKEKIVKGRATDKETFDFVEKLLKENIDKLPKKASVDEAETSMLKQGFAAALLAQLYFNAGSYIGKTMWDECATICEDIMAGKYGPYKLGEEWNDVFEGDNYTCGEIICGMPSNETYSGTRGAKWEKWLHYNTKNYLGGATYGDWNGYCIQPSYAPDGSMYDESDWKLGRVVSKFSEGDLRVQPYSYLGDGEYEGMFLMNQQISPSPRNPAGAGQTGEWKNNQWTGWVCMGARTYSGKILYLNDCIARFSLGNLNEAQIPELLVYDWTKDGEPLDKDGNIIERSKLGYLTSTIQDGEEASGWRLIKYSVPADKPDYDNLAKRMPAMYPVVRYAEIYYMLAECYFNGAKGKGKADAAKLINEVRVRNFADRVDPNPVTAANLDKYRLADEWMIEFLGEKRRRTDLIRWGMYTTENWWDHKASGSSHLNRFPISDAAISSNNLLEQNPGY